MADTLILAGWKFNHLERITSTGLVPTNEDSVFGPTALYDGRTSKPFKFSAAANDLSISADINIVANPSATASSSGWSSGSTGTGSVLISTTTSEAYSGSKAFVASGGSSDGAGRWYQDITVRSGEHLQVDLVSHGSTASSVIARANIKNLQTGNSLTTGGTWTASSSQDVSYVTASSYSQVAVPFQVEGFAASNDRDTVTLRFSLYTTGTTYAYFDDVTIYPATDFSSIHGHKNIDPTVTPKLLSSTSSGFTTATTEASFDPIQPAFYYQLAAKVYRRWWQLLLDGTPANIPSLNEWVLGQQLSLQRRQDYGFITEEAEPHTVNRTEIGETYVYAQTDQAARTLRFDWKWTQSVEFVEFRDELIRRARLGLYSTVLVPSDDEAEVMFGRIETSFVSSRVLLPQRDGGLTVMESPFGIVSST